MALTFSEARTIVQSRIADSSNATACDQAINQAQREVARRHRWPELMVRAFFNTSAAYETGTMAVVNGGTTWTLTGGTYPTDLATGTYRLALSVSDPWYSVVTRTDGTHAETTGSAYQEDTETASAFIAYKSHYSLASAVDRVEEIWLHRPGGAIPLVNALTDQHVSDFQHFPTGVGVPTHFYSMERDASGNRQILLGPDTPDDVYRVEYVYRKKTTDGSLSLDEARWPVVLARACAILYEPEFYERHIQAQAEYERLLAAEWASESEVETQHVRVGQGRVDMPGWTDMENLLGRGRVADPS